MTKEEANIKGREIFEEYRSKRKEIEQKAKEEGRWSKGGLDSNAHLFKELEEQTKRKLEKLNS